MARRPTRAADTERDAVGGRSGHRQRPGHSNQIRIIGGIHRGRKLRFPDLQGLRPTSDRTRETLFNWLQPVIEGASCLDLFAGSGALGFEAASRGAGRVVMLDRASQAIKSLNENAQLLGLKQTEITQADALKWLEQTPSQPFDIVFLDPPFADDLLSECCARLQSGGWLAEHAQIYVEVDLNRGLPQFPPAWKIVKEKRAGQVAFCLCQS